MIKFNALLRDEGLDPRQVRLVRHQDKRHKGRPTPYQLWRAADGRFDLYQRIQASLEFENSKLLAAFVVTPLDETLFVGLYEIGGVAKVPKGMVDPISDDDDGGLHFYSLSLSPGLADYSGRLVVNWEKGYRAWVQCAWKQDKPIIEIRRSVGDPPFPGFLNFHERLSMLRAVPQAWRQALAAVSGVYLLTCPKTGKQYVGSAGSETGFWGRWEDYAASGHGGNKRMLDLPAADYQVSILEVASSTAGLTELVAIENRWKEKLRTRQFGLNAN